MIKYIIFSILILNNLAFAYDMESNLCIVYKNKLKIYKKTIKDFNRTDIYSKRNLKRYESGVKTYCEDFDDKKDYSNRGSE